MEDKRAIQALHTFNKVGVIKEAQTLPSVDTVDFNNRLLTWLAAFALLLMETEAPTRAWEAVEPELIKRSTSRPFRAHAATFEALLNILDCQRDHKIKMSKTLRWGAD